MRHCIGLEYVLSPRSSFLNLSAQIDYQEAGLSAVFDSILLRVRGEMRRLFVFHDSQMLLKGLFVAFFTIKFLWNLDGMTEHNSWVSFILAFDEIHTLF